MKNQTCHTTLMIDDIINAVSGSKVLTKLDLNEGYYQLDSESRIITILSTYVNLECYKKLGFGINLAAVVLQNKIKKVLINFTNSDNIL